MRDLENRESIKNLTAAILAGCAIAGIGNTVQAEEIELTQKISDIPVEDLGTSKNISWKQLDTAPETDTPNTISVKVSESDTLYYSYEYVPHGYQIINERPDTSLDVTNIKNILFQDISTNYYQFGVTYTNNDKPEIDIKADFINNKVENNQEIIGGAINNSGKIGNISGDFVNNVLKSNAYRYSEVYGGNIFNSGTINNITGDFINNYGYSYGSEVNGVAICNRGTISNITGNFINNAANSFYTKTDGAAIYNYNNGVIGSINGNFINNKVETSYGSYTLGGAIYNSSIIGSINSNFINNSVKSSTSSLGGAIHNTGTIGNISGNFINNIADSYSLEGKGGAIYNSGTIGDKNTDGNVVGGIINSTFLNNFAETT